MASDMVDIFRELMDMYPEAAEEDASLARYTSARIGGRADILLRARTSEDLIKFATWLWEHDQSFEILGGGSNVLISDNGIRGVTLLNQAKALSFTDADGEIKIWAESGANLGAIARQAAQKGYSGLEWAAGIPGTIGGALVGNAGAHGGDISQVLVMAEILHIDNGRMRLDSDDLNFAYRTSDLKRMAKKAVVLSAEFKLHTNSKKDIQERMYANLGHRKLTQPPGASMGSMFKNPENDFAGRLIESVGLKGFQMGNAQISPLHGNFFLNKGDAKASEVYALISEAQARVQEKLGIHLELEIGLLGDWTDQK